MDVESEFGFNDIAVESLDRGLGQAKGGHEDHLDLDIVHPRKRLQERSPALSQLTGRVQHSCEMEECLVVSSLECGVHHKTTIVFDIKI